MAFSPTRKSTASRFTRRERRLSSVTSFPGDMANLSVGNSDDAGSSDEDEEDHESHVEGEQNNNLGSAPFLNTLLSPLGGAPFALGGTPFTGGTPLGTGRTGTSGSHHARFTEEAKNTTPNRKAIAAMSPSTSVTTTSIGSSLARTMTSARSLSSTAQRRLESYNKGMHRFGKVTNCSRCQYHPSFCVSCSARFDILVHKELCEQIAFRQRVKADFSEMFNELTDRVDFHEKMNRAKENRPGDALTKKQRYVMRERALEGLQMASLTHTLKTELVTSKSKKQNYNKTPIDLVPPDVIHWLADIDDSTRAWLHQHDSKHLRNARDRARSQVNKTLRAQDNKVDVLGPCRGATMAIGSVLPVKRANVGVPRAHLRLPRSMGDLRESIESRKAKYNRPQKRTGR